MKYVHSGEFSQRRCIWGPSTQVKRWTWPSPERFFPCFLITDSSQELPLAWPLSPWTYTAGIMCKCVSCVQRFPSGTLKSFGSVIACGRGLPLLPLDSTALCGIWALSHLELSESMLLWALLNLLFLWLWVCIPAWHTPGVESLGDRVCGPLGSADSSKVIAQICIPISSWKGYIIYINKTLLCFLTKHILDKHFLYQMILPGDLDMKHACHFLRTKLS